MTPPTLPAQTAAEFTLPQRYRTDRRTPLRWLFSHLWRYWPLGLMLFLGAASNGALAAVVPLTVGNAFEAILESPPRIELLWGFVWLVNIREELYTSLLGKSMTFHALQSVGDTMARATNDVREISVMFNPGFNLVIGAAMFLFTPIFAALAIHPALMLTPTLFTIAYFLSIWQYLTELAPVTRELRTSFGKLNSRLSEALDGIETVKGAAQEKEEIKLFKGNTKRFRDAYVREGYIEARFLPMR